MMENRPTITEQDRLQFQELQTCYQKIVQSLQQRIVGMEEVIEQILICIFSGGHALVVGVPGLAKTLLIRSVAELLDLKFSRIQFTPDLMPSDITGTEIIVPDEEKLNRVFKFLRGPIFANLILADEINRTPPKTQSALLEAMEECTVTTMGERFVLDPPFFVLATQNPIEQEGTYPLPTTQLDRFMFNSLVDYPSNRQEYRIMRLTIAKAITPLTTVLTKEKIVHFLQLVRKVEIPADVMKYAIDLCRNSRPQNATAPKIIRDCLSWGASPRATQSLVLGGKARAMLHGNFQVSAADIRAIIHPVMRHRILLSYQAEADGMTPDEVIDHLLTSVPAPDGNFAQAARPSYSQRLYLSVFNR